VKRISLLAVIASVLLATAAHAELVDRVAAVVNSDIIPLSEVYQRAAPELGRINAERDAAKRNKLRDEVLKLALDQLIGEKLLEAEIKELNIDVTDQELESALDDVRRQNKVDADQFEQMLRQEGFTIAQYRDFIRKHVARLKLVNLKVRGKVKIADEDLKVEYNKFSKLEGEDPEIHARHILVKLDPKASAADVEAAQKKAAALAVEARQPGVDFIELAKQKSEGPSANDGGDLGFFRRGVMVPEFERIAFNLQEGQISDPVRTKFGFHVIKVDERRNVAVKPFEEMKDQLRERLMRGQLEKYTNDYVQELRQKAAVEVKI
jgi:peptidyl-prolyl cis-trans isomerase SurA